MNTASYAIALAFIALISSPYLLRRFSKAKTDAYGTFAVGARNFGWFRICAGLSATFVGGAAVINLAGLGYSYGWYGLADVIPTSGALVFSALVIVPLLAARKAVSLGSYLRGSSKLAGAATGLLSAVVYTLICAAQIVALVKLAQPFFPAVPPQLIACIGTFAVASYIFFGGYSAVTVTDVIQFIVMTLLYFALVGGTILFGGAANTGSPIQSQVMGADLLLLLALPFLFVPVSQDMHIRINSAKTTRDARNGVLLAGVCYFLFGLISVSVGLSLAKAGITLRNPDDAVPTFLASHFGAFAVIPTIAVVCVVVSTLDSVLFASASSLAYDFWDSISSRSREKDSTHPRIATLVVLAVALFIAMQAPQILRLILSALIIYIAVLFPMLIGRFFKKDARILGILAFIALAGVLAVEVYGYKAPFRAFLYAGIHLVVVILVKKEEAT
jgi:solute:Na+ symporter, SSS family